MSEEDTAATGETTTPRIWDEQAVSLLVQQMRFMMEHEVKTMKLDVIENMGSMLARRSGIDREIRDVTGRVDLLVKMIERFGSRLAALEKAIKPPGAQRSRVLTAPSPAPPPPAPAVDDAHRRGRPPGKGRYPHNAELQRASKARGVTS
ncbi:MAG: hypothetical protein ABSG63_17180 [Spirochaetia bacterium]|jgi:hypothetical protein